MLEDQPHRRLRCCRACSPARADRASAPARRCRARRAPHRRGAVPGAGAASSDLISERCATFDDQVHGGDYAFADYAARVAGCRSQAARGARTSSPAASRMRKQRSLAITSSAVSAPLASAARTAANQCASSECSDSCAAPVIGVNSTTAMRPQLPSRSPDAGRRASAHRAAWTTIAASAGEERIATVNARPGARDAAAAAAALADCAARRPTTTAPRCAARRPARALAFSAARVQPHFDLGAEAAQLRAPPGRAATPGRCRHPSRRAGSAVCTSLRRDAGEQEARARRRRAAEYCGPKAARIPRTTPRAPPPTTRSSPRSDQPHMIEPRFEMHRRRQPRRRQLRGASRCRAQTCATGRRASPSSSSSSASQGRQSRMRCGRSREAQQPVEVGQLDGRAAARCRARLPPASTGRRESA